MAHANQERYSALVDAKLRATLVTRDGAIFNTRYEGSPKAGKVKIPVRDTEVAVKAYDKANGVDADAGTTTYLDLDIDNARAVNEIIDGFDAASVPDDITAERLDSAATPWLCPSTKSPSRRCRAQRVPTSAPPRPPAPFPPPTRRLWLQSAP